MLAQYIFGVPQILSFNLPYKVFPLICHLHTDFRLSIETARKHLAKQLHTGVSVRGPGKFPPVFSAQGGRGWPLWLAPVAVRQPGGPAPLSTPLRGGLTRVLSQHWQNSASGELTRCGYSSPATRPSDLFVFLETLLPGLYRLQPPARQPAAD